MNVRVSMLPPFVSTQRISRVIGGLFFITAAVSWIAVGYDLSEVRLAGAIVSGADVASTEVLSHSIAGDIIGAIQLWCAALTAVIFLVWLHRVRVNVRALGVRRLVYGREWTLLAFLVPFLNAFRPLAVVREIWKASDPGSGDPLHWQAHPTPTRLHVWWWSFVAYVTLEGLSGLVLLLATGVARIQFAHALGMGADACAALSASVAYFVVTGISDAQEAKRERWGAGADAPVAPRLIDPREHQPRIGTAFGRWRAF
jgi:hypothetical protein